MTTATVNVLSAEVRVLMVGSRQVTMSVFRQLDVVEPEELDVFGRVSYQDPEDVKRGQDVLWVVGRDSGGVLVGALLEDASYWDTDDWSVWARQKRKEWLELPLIVLAGLR